MSDSSVAEMKQLTRFSTFLYTILIVAVIMVTITDTQVYNHTSCDQLGIRFYESINCKPHVSNLTDCPLYYTCPNYTIAEEHCVYQGEMYKPGEIIAADKFYKKTCICHENFRSGQMQVRCPSSYCMRFTNNECYQKFTLDNDCSIGEICPPFENTTNCTIDGSMYRNGEIFRPRGTCWKCLCQKGFNGTIEEPFCVREPCLAELFHYEKISKLCLPVYHLFNRDEAPCCPNKFICANQIVNMQLISEADYDEVLAEENCLVGEWEIKFGTVFNVSYMSKSTKDYVICACRVPPLPICYSKYYF